MTKRAIERWNRLKTNGTGDGVMEVPSIDSGVATGFGTARFAIGSQGQPRVLVPVGKSVPLQNLNSTSKLRVTISIYSVSGKSTAFIDIMCLDKALDGVFAELAEEILCRISEGIEPFKSVNSSINDFRELLKENTPEDIPEHKVMGLVGELQVLKQILDCHPSATKTWTGPFDLRHDFRGGNHAIEVKTSGRSDKKLVSIHGIDQLAAPLGGTLHLAHLKLEKVQNGELAVGSLFAALVNAGADENILIRGLEALGCSDPHDAAWNSCSFSIEGLDIYNVSDGFPRIIASSFGQQHLLDGISSLEYKIDLTHANSFKLLIDEHKLVFNRIAR